jgi:hypothetical protein
VADIQTLKSIYRRLAAQEAGTSLPAQKAYLDRIFTAHAKNVDEGDVVGTSISKLGSNSAWLHRGATSEERAHAVNLALVDLEGEIAGLGSVTAPAPLIMRFGESPFSTLG